MLIKDKNNIFQVPPEGTCVYYCWENAVIDAIAEHPLTYEGIKEKLNCAWILQPNMNYIQLNDISFHLLITKDVLLETGLFNIDESECFSLKQCVKFQKKYKFYFTKQHIGFFYLVLLSLDSLLNQKKEVSFNELCNSLKDESYLSINLSIEGINIVVDKIRIYYCVVNSPYF